MTNEKKSSSAVFNINYHLIWCPKYRRKLSEQYRDAIETMVRSICDSKNWEIRELRIMDDHLHLFLSAPPYDSPTSIIKILKGVTARQMFLKYPELRKTFRTGHLWSPSYYVGTAGNISAETIERYIREVNTRRRGNPE